MRAVLKYIGSKHSLLEYIDYVFDKINRKEQTRKLTVLDGFAGSGAVGRHLIKRNNVIANDLEYYSYVNYATLCVNYTERLQTIIDTLRQCARVYEGRLLSNLAINIFTTEMQ